MAVIRRDIASIVTGRNLGHPLLAEMPDWFDDALCAQVDTELFYPEKGQSTREAKRVCAACPVRDACLDYALEHHERFGIWGGKSERERRKLELLQEAS